MCEDLHFDGAKVSAINNYAHEIRPAGHKLGQPTLKESPTACESIYM